jgi:adenine-specific DNA-methyltransferase
MNNSETNQASKVGDLSQSLDVANLKMEQLRQLFPEIFTEGKIDIKRLTATLGENVATGRESYELSWAGKADARAEIQKRTTATLRPDTANSVNWDATQNLYIEGENLEVLRTLQKAYFGKVKMIYIDPPYNTGNDSFVYPDDYSETLKDYQARTGQTDEAGFVNKRRFWKNTKKRPIPYVWLSMMYPRLFWPAICVMMA